MSLLLTLFSAVLLPLSLPNELLRWGSPLLGVIALVPVFVALMQNPDRRRASRHGALFGAVSTAIGSYWLAFFGDFAVWTIGGAVLGYTIYNYILFGYLHTIVHGGTFRRPGSSLHPIWLAAAWAGYEYLKSVGFLGYPWGLIAYPLAALSPLAQIAEMTGTWGLSFLAAYINAALAVVLVRQDHPVGASRSAVRHVATAALLLVAAGTGGLWAAASVEPRETRHMLLVQQNVDSWQPGAFPQALEEAQRLTLTGIAEAREDEPIDAVVWSETALRRSYDPADTFYQQEPAWLPFRLFLDLIDVPLITGSPMPAGGQDATNSALVILPDGSVTGTYGKQQLVPFAESIPGWHRPAIQRFFREVIGLFGTWVPGPDSRPVPLPLRDGRRLMIGLPICFEDAFGWVPREMVNNGAELLVNLTNNSWSRQDSAQTQHYVAARLRAIELRTSLVRGTNSGLSTVVDARGRSRSALPMFAGASEVLEVPLYPPRWTLYRAWGDWLGIVLALLAILRAASWGLHPSGHKKTTRGTGGSRP